MFLQRYNFLTKHKVLAPAQYDFLISSEIDDFYDRPTREKLYRIIEKLENFKGECTWTETRLRKKYRCAKFGMRLQEDRVSVDKLIHGGSLRMEAKHMGDVSVRNRLVIAQGAHQEGDVSAAEVHCQGTIIGNERADRKVTIHPGGIVVGNIVAPALQFDSGASFEGNCQVDLIQHRKETPPRKSLVAQIFGSG